MVARRIVDFCEVDLVRAAEAGDRVGEVRAGGVFELAAGRGEMNSAAAGRRGVGEFERPSLIPIPPVKVLAAVRSSVPGPSRTRSPAPALAPVPPEPVWSAMTPRIVSTVACRRRERYGLVALQEEAAAERLAVSGAAAAEAAGDGPGGEIAALDGERGARHHEDVAARAEPAAAAAEVPAPPPKPPPPPCRRRRRRRSRRRRRWKPAPPAAAPKAASRRRGR